MVNTSKSVGLRLLSMLDIRDGSVITEAEINSVRRILKADDSQYCEMMSRTWYIGQEQADKGRRFWAAMLMTAKGHYRHNKFTRMLAVWQIETASDIERFELVDFDFQYNALGDCVGVYPVYRLFGRNGCFFTYTSRAWQSGGIEILG
jgi:hypothetical protein